MLKLKGTHVDWVYLYQKVTLVLSFCWRSPYLPGYGPVERVGINTYVLFECLANGPKSPVRRMAAVCWTSTYVDLMAAHSWVLYSVCFSSMLSGYLKWICLFDLMLHRTRIHHAEGMEYVAFRCQMGGANL